MTTLSTEQQILIETRLQNESKSTVVTYLIWLFLGWFGGHRFYLGRNGSGAAMLILTVLGFFTLAVFVGAILLAIVGFWVLIDAFLIPGMVNQHRKQLRDDMTSMASVGAASSSIAADKLGSEAAPLTPAQ